MKIACDVCISNRSIKFLTQKGFEIVLKAAAGQPDKEWFAAALELGATVFISGDADIAYLVERQYDKKIKWVNFAGLAYDEGKVNFWLMDRLNQLKEVWGL